MDEDPEPNLCSMKIGSCHITSYMIPKRESLALYLLRYILHKGCPV